MPHCPSNMLRIRVRTGHHPVRSLCRDKFHATTPLCIHSANVPAHVPPLRYSPRNRPEICSPAQLATSDQPLSRLLLIIMQCQALIQAKKKNPLTCPPSHQTVSKIIFYYYLLFFPVLHCHPKFSIIYTPNFNVTFSTLPENRIRNGTRKGAVLRWLDDPRYCAHPIRHPFLSLIRHI